MGRAFPMPAGIGFTMAILLAGLAFPKQLAYHI
jgi:Na+/H+ antiporter NhaA